MLRASPGCRQFTAIPFDRLLVAQSLAEPMTLLTNDAVLVGYGPFVQLV